MSRYPKKSIKDFIAESVAIHGSKFDYTNTVLINRRTKVNIFCNTCNTEFKQAYPDHLRGHGCAKCSNIKLVAERTRTTEEYISQCRQLFPANQYDYTDTVYTGVFNDVKVLCNKCNNYFTKKAYVHSQGYGCLPCYGNKIAFYYKLDKPAILYYIKVGEAYKIGVTNRTVKERFSVKELETITILHIEHFTIGAEAYKKEQEILRTYKEFKYEGEDLLKTGNTELFTVDILNKDHE